ncbi:uncharacterized protein [Pempheris klunzingeri]|uniref:uncharacterized protein n=1 Tax=Pempheris klunzingeri TaxID=3127111 RepID=UPI00397FB6B9
MWKILGFFIVFFSWSSVTAASQDKVIYKAVGGKVVLTPDFPAHPITSVMWKHEADIAMEWYGGEVDSYRHFKVRGMLNSSSGAMTITGLARNDSGSYTARINNQFTTTTQLEVISPVSKPSVSIWCHAEKVYCLFTCEGNTTDAEPITYGWTAHDMRWLLASKVRNITKDETEPVFKCILENPVSSKSSEDAHNPFSTRHLIWPKLGIIISLVLLICVVFIIIFVYKYRKVTGDWDVKTVEEQSTVLLKIRQSQDSTSVVPPDTNNGTAIPSISEVPETSIQVSTSDVAPHTSEGTGNSAVMSGGEETPADIQPADDQQEKEPSETFLLPANSETSVTAGSESKDCCSSTPESQ